MGSSSSSTRHRRVTFGDEDGRDDIVEEYTESYPARGPTKTTTTIERMYTDQDSFELGDPRASRSRESTFSLGQRIQKRAEDDEHAVDRIIQEHHKTTNDRRDPSPSRVVTKTVTEREMFDGSTSSDGMQRVGRRLQTIQERPLKPTMTEYLWTPGGRRYYDAEHSDNWSVTGNGGGTRLELTTHGRSSLRANNGVKVLSGEVLKPIEPMTVVDEELFDERRPYRHRVVRTHRDTADPLPSARYYRDHKKGISSRSVASSTSSLVSERTKSDSGQHLSRYSRHYSVDRRPRRRHYNDDDDNNVVERIVIHRHVRAPQDPKPDVVKVTRHREGRTPGVAYEDERSGDENDSGYRGQSPRRSRDDFDEKDYRRAASARRLNDRTYVTRHVYE